MKRWTTDHWRILFLSIFKCIYILLNSSNMKFYAKGRRKEMWKKQYGFQHLYNLKKKLYSDFDNWKFYVGSTIYICIYGGSCSLWIYYFRFHLDRYISLVCFCSLSSFRIFLLSMWLLYIYNTNKCFQYEHMLQSFMIILFFKPFKSKIRILATGKRKTRTILCFFFLTFRHL